MKETHSNKKARAARRVMLAALAACALFMHTGAKSESFTAAPSKQGQNVSVKFQDADIRQVITFLQDVSGRIVIADTDVKGTVSVTSDVALPVDEALSVVNSALKSRGYTMVQNGNVIRIVPTEESKQTNVPTRIGNGYEDLPDNEQIITQVVPLKHTDATKIRADLKALVGKNGEILDNAESNSVIITDTSANVKRLLQIIQFLDKDSPRQAQIRVYNLDYAKAKDMAALISQLPKSSAQAPSGEPQQAGMTTTYPAVQPAQPPASIKALTGSLEISGDLTVLADERSNSLVIATAPQNFAPIEKLIESLDRMLSQVLIEVVIMEASLDTTTKLGMEWSALKERTVNGNAVSGTGSTNWGIANEQFGFKADILKFGGAQRLLAFLMQQQERINILSAPMILTSDNQEASITVGSEVPYLKETRRSVGDTRDYVYEYKNVGISLKVTPHINEQRYVVLDIHQEIKKLGPQTLFDAFMIITREADANVVVHDKQTIVLGGLMRDDQTITNNSVPLLSNIPLIGKLFNYKRTVGEKTELLVFITPHVVTSQEQVEMITREQKDRMKTLQGQESEREKLKEQNGKQ